MNYKAIRVELEKSLSEELYELFGGNVVNQIIRDTKVERSSDQMKLIHEGMSFKISKKLSPPLFAICRDVQEKLQFDEPLDFFVRNDPDTNASAITRREEEHNHLIVLNSGLIERFDDDELKFVIGHEIGHLISKNTEITKIIKLIFPELNEAPLVLQNKIMLWIRLSELTADRYGYIASPHLDKCISNFFKLASGLDTERIALDNNAYLEEVDELLSRFKKEPLAIATHHPVNPIRIKALQLFSESSLFQTIAKKGSIVSDVELNSQIDDLVQLLTIVGDSELDIYRMRFIAAAGLILASSDQHVSESEIDHIVGVLGGLTMFPKGYLDHIAQQDNPSKIFQESAAVILDQNPGERYGMFDFLIDTVMSDRAIEENEIKLLYDIGEKMFNFSKKEMAQLILNAIQKNFLPRLYRK